jgi:hypothetical protein
LFDQCAVLGTGDKVATIVLTAKHVTFPIFSYLERTQQWKLERTQRWKLESAQRWKFEGTQRWKLERTQRWNLERVDANSRADGNTGTVADAN